MSNAKRKPFHRVDAKFRNGRSHKVSPEAVERAKAAIETMGLPFDGPNLLEYSRPEESETHPEFTWDDHIAAERQRLREAGDLVADYYEIIIDEQGVISERPVYFSIVSEDGKRSWKEASFIDNQEESQEQQLRECLAALRGIATRYSGIASCKSIVAAVRAILAAQTQD